MKVEEKERVTWYLHVRRGAPESTNGLKMPFLLCPFFIGVQLFPGQACTRAASVLRPVLGRPHSQRIMGKGWAGVGTPSGPQSLGQAEGQQSQKG